MILTLVGVSNGTLHESARRARGTGADILVRPPGTSALSSLSSSPMSDKFPAILRQEPHVVLATGTIIQPLELFDSITGLDNGLPQSFEREIALNPAESLKIRPPYSLYSVSVATVHTGFQRPISGFDLRWRKIGMFPSQKSLCLGVLAKIMSVKFSTERRKAANESSS